MAERFRSFASDRSRADHERLLHYELCGSGASASGPLFLFVVHNANPDDDAVVAPDPAQTARFDENFAKLWQRRIVRATEGELADSTSSENERRAELVVRALQVAEVGFGGGGAPPGGAGVTSRRREPCLGCTVALRTEDQD